MRLLALIVSLVATVGPLGASTLEQLSIDEMIAKSTEIVRGRIVSSRPVVDGQLVYTVSRVDVLERWKGLPAEQVEVAIPGGSHGSLRQTFAGAPELEPGRDYVLFLWTGSNGITQVIGLSQGVFTVETDGDGAAYVERPASQVVMLDAGNPVDDRAVSMPLGELRGRVERQAKGRE